MLVLRMLLLLLLLDSPRLTLMLTNLSHCIASATTPFSYHFFAVPLVLLFVVFYFSLLFAVVGKHNFKSHSYASHEMRTASNVD